MRRDWSNHESIHIRREDGTSRSERIGRGTRRGRKNQAVGFVIAYENPVHEQIKIGHTRDGALARNYVVQRAVLGNTFTRAHELAMQHGAPLRTAAVLMDGFQRGVKIFQSDFGKKSQRAQIHAEDWYPGVS